MIERSGVPQAEVEQLRALLASARLENGELRSALERAVREHEAVVIRLTAELLTLKRQLFGPKAERIRNADAQESFLDILVDLGRLQKGDVAAQDRAEATLGELRKDIFDPAAPWAAAEADLSGRGRQQQHQWLHPGDPWTALLLSAFLPELSEAVRASEWDGEGERVAREATESDGAAPRQQSYEAKPGAACAALPSTYRRRDPEATVLHEVVREHLSTFLLECAQEGGLPRFVEKDFTAYLECGVLARGFCRVVCSDCKDEFLVAYSCKRRRVCPSCNARRAHDTAIHLEAAVLPRLPGVSSPSTCPLA